MKYILTGNLCRDICKGCRQPLYPGTIRFYLAPLTHETVIAASASNKDTVTILDKKQAASLADALVGEAKVDAHGNYRAELKGYKQGQLRVVVEVDHPDPREKDKVSSQYVYITTFQPVWQYNRAQSEAFAIFDYCFPAAFWCELLRIFDLWVICGRVVSCRNPKVPVVGVEVTAMDADIITDDLLGTAVTDATGHFRIYYRTADFKRTFLSPFINVETPFGGVLGPDVYFVIKTSDGDILLEETRQDGKRKDRKDVPRCFCADLCAEVALPPPRVPLWSGVGSDFVISTFGNMNDFDDEGYASAGAHKYAIWSKIHLTGDGPNPLVPTSNAVYRFRVSDVTAANSAVPVAEGNFSRTVGVTPGLFVEGVNIGRLARLLPSLRYVNVYLSAADLDAEGWVDVKAAVNRTLLASSEFSPADLTDPAQTWVWDDRDPMIGIDTRALTNEEAHNPPSGLSAGDAYPAASKFPVEKVAIRFEIRDKVTLAPLPGNGITMNSMVVNNSGIVLRTALKNGSGVVAPCQQFTSEDVFYAYTLYHPNLGSASLSVSSNDGAYNFNPPAFANNVPKPGIDAVHDGGLMLVPRPTHTCTYRARLSFKILRHNGENAETGHQNLLIFYYEE